MGEQRRLSGCTICIHVIEAEAVLEYKKKKKIVTDAGGVCIGKRSLQFFAVAEDDNNSYTFVSLSTFTCIISLQTHTHPGRFVAWFSYHHPTDGLRAHGASENPPWPGPEAS